MTMKNHLLANRITSITESATIAMSQKSRAMKSEGIEVINLSLGEPDFNTPEAVKEAAKEAIDLNITKYPPIAGFEDLRSAICDKFKNENNLNFQPDQIIVSTGAKQCIANVIFSLIEAEDEVILPAPYWVSYKGQVELAGGKVIELQSDRTQNFKSSAAQLEAAITTKTKLIIFSSPCNPSGSIYTEEELRAWAKVISKHPQVMILSDEIYEYINFMGQHFSIGSIPEISDQVVTVNGVAKGFAMTGWRIGYLGGPKWLASACAKMQGQFTSGANSIAQRAALAAINGGKKLSSPMVKAFEERKKLILELSKLIVNFEVNDPKGAFYIFPDVSYFIGKKFEDTTITSSDHLCEIILENAHVACVGGTSFGAPNNIRISYATSEQNIRTAMLRIKKVLDKVQCSA